MKTILHIIGLIFIQQLAISQNRDIMECLRLIDFKFEKYNESDFYRPTDTILDIKAGYYELYVSNTHVIDNVEQNTILCQATKFNNSDGSITLAITGYYADEQCSNYPSYFYEISENGDSIKIIEESKILPSLNWKDFFSESKSINVLEKYLLEIQKNYLDSNATIFDVLGEIYDYHYILPRYGKTIKATLSICDYIPTNVVSINENDWKIIEKDFKTLDLIYNNTLKTFILSTSK